jgi:hypothetical protein
MSNNDKNEVIPLMQREGAPKYVWSAVAVFAITAVVALPVNSRESIEAVKTNPFEQVEHEASKLQQSDSSNPFLGFFEGKRKFKMNHTIDEVRAALPVNTACQNLFKSNRIYNDVIIYIVTTNLAAIAIEGAVADIETMVKADGLMSLAPYRNNMTGSFQFFAFPTPATEINSQKLITERMRINGEQTTPLEQLQKQTSGVHLNTFFSCVLLDMQLGAYGMETKTKTVATNLSNSISDQNARLVTKKLDGLVQNTDNILTDAP